MSDANKKNPPPVAPVIPLQNFRCPAQDCSKKPQKAGFCNEHYLWFKEGLISKEGVRPRDFDKKHQAFLKRRAA